MTAEMAKEEGILAGDGVSEEPLIACMELAKELKEGRIVCITCDGRSVWLSSDLFGESRLELSGARLGY